MLNLPARRALVFGACAQALKMRHTFACNGGFPRILFNNSPTNPHLPRCGRPAAIVRRCLTGISMAVERTLSIIKPDAVARNVIGQIYARFEGAGVKIIAARMMHLSREQAGGFYAVHKERPFYADLVSFMSSGPVMIQVLEGEDAIRRNRDLMGATDPKKAAAGTIRADFAESIDANAVHGSDGADTAQTEIAFFFPTLDLHSR